MNALQLQRRHNARSLAIATERAGCKHFRENGLRRDFYNAERRVEQLRSILCGVASMGGTISDKDKAELKARLMAAKTLRLLLK